MFNNLKMNPLHHSFDINKELQTAIVSNDLARVEQLVRYGANVNFRISDGQPVLHLAINIDAYSIAERLLKFGANPHAVSMKPSREGYTPLHFACLKDHQELMESLITTYHADPQAIAADGAQPIHFVLLNDNSDIIKLLLQRSVSPETRIDKLVFDKFYRESSISYWRGDFGDDVSLLTFAVLYDKYKCIPSLIEHGANVRVKNVKNQTLLMNAAFHRHLVTTRYLVAKLSRAEINYVDNDGFTALHHLFIQEIRHYRRNQPKGEQSRGAYFRSEIVELLVNFGANINALIRGDPSTLLVNMVAYLRDYQLLDFLLPRQKFLPIFQPIFYAMMPSTEEYPSNYLPLVRNDDSMWYASYTMIDTIIKDIKLRIAMGYPVGSEEVARLNNVNLKYLRNNEYHQTVEQLKHRTLKFNNKTMSIFEILSKKDSELQELAVDNYFLQALDNYHRKALYDEEKIVTMIKVHIDHVSREPLLKKVKKISFFPNTLFHNIPLICVVEIAKYLDVYDLRNFVNTYCQFYS